MFSVLLLYSLVFNTGSNFHIHNTSNVIKRHSPLDADLNVFFCDIDWAIMKMFHDWTRFLNVFSETGL